MWAGGGVSGGVVLSGWERKQSGSENKGTGSVVEAETSKCS